jgi:hypothetical protein
MGHLRAYKVVDKRTGHTTRRNLNLVLQKTKHILLARNTVPNSRLDQNTRNLRWQHGRLVLAVVLEADTWDPKRRGGTGPLVG